MELLLKNIMRTVLIDRATPDTLTINGVKSSTFQDSQFVFGDRFPLQKDTTRFNINIGYKYRNETTGTIRDTTVNINFLVRRSATPRPLPNGSSLRCWSQTRLDLFADNSPVTVVNETMNNLEVRIVPGDPSAQPVTAAVTTSSDSENFTLTQSGSYYTATFSREIAPAKPGDRTLQHAVSDSIIVVYRNPKIPLDTLRKAYPFRISRGIIAQNAAYFDRNADGYIDSIFVAVEGALTDQDMTTLQGWVTLPAHRRFTDPVFKAVPGGFAVLVTSPGTSAPNTVVTDQDRLTVRGGILPNGGLVTDATIQIADKVAPVIIRALGKIDFAGPETLIVYFSEPMLPVNAVQPFLFRHEDGTLYNQNFRAVTVTADGGFVFAAAAGAANQLAAGDTVWINPPALVGDTLRNYQSNPDNRRVPVTIVQAPFTVSVQVSRNPFVPNASPVPAFISALDGTKKEGVIVRIEPDRQLRKDIVLRGTASIYDVVKNPVIENQVLLFDPDRHRLYLVWDGRNSKGRLVATGTYLAVLEITDGGHFKERKTVRIGVKR